MSNHYTAWNMLYICSARTFKSYLGDYSLLVHVKFASKIYRIFCRSVV